jgi:hypothetical protein
MEEGYRGGKTTHQGKSRVPKKKKRELGKRLKYLGEGEGNMGRHDMTYSPFPLREFFSRRLCIRLPPSSLGKKKH